MHQTGAQCKIKRYKNSSAWEHTEGKGFHRMNNSLSQWFHNPAELEDDLRILKSLKKGKTTYLEVWFSWGSPT